MRNIMKRNTLLASAVILTFISVLSLSSCSFDLSQLRAAQLTSAMSSEADKIDSMSREIIRCFTKKDKDGLKQLFCEKTRNNPDFDTQIDMAFEYFKCEVYINSEIDTSASGGESWNSGVKTQWHVSPDIPYIKTLDYTGTSSSGNRGAHYYNMNYYWKITDVDDSTKEGLQYLCIELLNIDSVSIGEILY